MTGHLQQPRTVGRRREHGRQGMQLVRQITSRVLRHPSRQRHPGAIRAQHIFWHRRRQRPLLSRRIDVVICIFFATGQGRLGRVESRRRLQRVLSEIHLGRRWIQRRRRRTVGVLHQRATRRGLHRFGCQRRDVRRRQTSRLSRRRRRRNRTRNRISRNRHRQRDRHTRDQTETSQNQRAETSHDTPPGTDDTMARGMFASEAQSIG